jgi:hypothetical protein
MKSFIIILISTFSIAVFSQTKRGSLKLSKEAILFWEIKDFNKQKHSFKTCSFPGGKYICEIDGKKWFGSDYGMTLPKNQLTKLEIKIKDRFYKLETSQMFNPNYSGELSEIQFKLKKFKNFYRLYSFFSDGAGSYSAYWKIEEKSSKREILSNDEKYFEWQLEN